MPRILKHLSFLAFSLVMFACARQDNPTPQAQVYRFQDTPQVIRLYKLGSTDTLLSRLSVVYLADGKLSSYTMESFNLTGLNVIVANLRKYFKYNPAGQLERSDFVIFSPGISTEYLIARSDWTYTSDGKISTYSFDDSINYYNANSAREQFAYNADGSYEIAKVDVVNGRRSSFYQRILMGSNGLDSLIQSRDSLSATWQDQKRYSYDQANRLTQEVDLLSSQGRVGLDLSNYQTCKVPVRLLKVISSNLTTGRMLPYSYFHYIFTDPNAIAARIDGGVSFGQFELDNSSGPAIEVNPAGYLQTLRYTKINNNSSRPVLNKYRVEFDY